ncbi:hypothetical protein [Cellulomonas soli]
MTGSPSRLPRGPRSALGTLLVGVATASSVLALGSLLEPGRWRTVAWLSLALLAAVLIGMRALTRSWWAPTLSALVVAAAGLVLRYGSPRAASRCCLTWPRSTARSPRSARART